MNALNKIVFLASLAVPALVFADDTLGTGGTVSSLEVNTPSADTYLQFHGRVVIMTVSGKNSSSNVEYRWGGTSCGSRVLSDAVVAMLQRALESGTPILPRFQIGQGDSKCLVGFKFTP